MRVPGAGALHHCEYDSEVEDPTSEEKASACRFSKNVQRSAIRTDYNCLLAVLSGNIRSVHVYSYPCCAIRISDAFGSLPCVDS